MSASTRALSTARKRLGCGCVRKQVVFEAAALAMGRPVPVGKKDGYALLREFTGIHASKKSTPTRKTVVTTPRLVAKPLKRKKLDAVVTDEFLLTYEWRRLRMEVVVERGARCECCGATPADGTTVINVDHIKPRRKYPELALAKSNLQVLCGPCNHGKGNWDQTDWRAHQEPIVEDFTPLWGKRGAS